MPALRFSRRAKSDLLSIASYTLKTWGEAQAIRYVAGIEAYCELLAVNPAVGRVHGEVRSGLRRAEHNKHVVLYRQDVKGILISRVLHRSMLVERHTLETKL